MVLSKHAQNNLSICYNIFSKKQKYFPILKEYSLHVTRREGLLGTTKFLKKKIYIHYNLLDLGHLKQIIDTLLHEIAHAIDLNMYNYQRKRGGYHGLTWKTLAKRFNVCCEDSGVLFDYKCLEKPADYNFKEFLRNVNNLYSNKN